MYINQENHIFIFQSLKIKWLEVYSRLIDIEVIRYVYIEVAGG